MKNSINYLFVCLSFIFVSCERKNETECNELILIKKCIDNFKENDDFRNFVYAKECDVCDVGICFFTSSEKGVILYINHEGEKKEIRSIRSMSNYDHMIELKPSAKYVLFRMNPFDYGIMDSGFVCFCNAETGEVEGVIYQW